MLDKLRILDVLQQIEQSLYAEKWKCKSLEIIEQYKARVNIDNKVVIKLLEKLAWFLVRNRFIEARRLIRQEIENIQGITEQKCKLVNINNGYCRICHNINCNLNVREVKA